jgi:hypothetical protein
VGEKVKTNWACHDVGKLSGGQYLSFHHFREPRVAMRHEGAQEHQGLVDIGREAF